MVIQFPDQSQRLKAVRDVGLSTRERIMARTLAGRDVRGEVFTGYSKGYAARKQAALHTVKRGER